MHAGNFELFVDESGRFDETAPGARHEGRASQYAGILAPAGRFTEEVALDLLGEAHEAAGLELGAQVHAAEIGDQDRFWTLVGTLAARLPERGFQAVRISNRERVHYGDRVSETVHLLAELLLRVFAARAGQGGMHVSLIPASIKLGDRADGGPDLIPSDEYERRLREALAFTAVRRGRAGSVGQWNFRLRFGSGKADRVLQVCDLLSNASYGDFKRCDQGARDALRRAFGDYDFTLLVRPRLELAAELIDLGSVALALQFLAEEELSSGANTPLTSYRRKALDALRALPAGAREASLAQLLAWLDTLVEGRANLDRALAASRWLRDHVVKALRAGASGSPPVDTFEFGVRRRALSAANHQGAPERALTELRALAALRERVGGQLEALAEEVEARLAEAVFHTDVAAWDRVDTLLSPVIAFFDHVTDLFQGEETPVSAARSELRGKALGTLLQARIYRSGGRQDDMAEARKLSDRALQEFSAPHDLARQQQYRCLLETIAGDLPAAREWLGRSLGLDAPDDAALAATIAGLQGHAQGFALLHWTRLGARLAFDGALAERDGFRQTFAAAGLSSNPWLVSPEANEYPAHGIRRYVAACAAAWGDLDLARSCLARGRELQALERKQAVLALMQIGGQLEVAAHTLLRDPRVAKKLLSDSEGAEAIARLRASFASNGFEAITDRLDRWGAVVRRVLEGELEGEAARAALLGCGREAWW